MLLGENSLKQLLGCLISRMLNKCAIKVKVRLKKEIRRYRLLLLIHFLSTSIAIATTVSRASLFEATLFEILIPP